MPKTQAEIEELKRQWMGDPCWDIYTTEGFEDYEEELKAFQEDIERDREIARENELKALAEKLGVPGNIALARAWELMETKLDILSNRLRLIELE